MPSADVARHDDLDNYGVDDFSDDPFNSPAPEDKSSKKRKEPELGLDEEVVQKRVRVPNVKLDENRLLGPAGIPKLRARARDLKIKGKGHEFSDASRLLSFYQRWLDDLFPKAKFLDALVMVEKAGHKKTVVAARNEFINEGRPRGYEEEEAAEDVDAQAANHISAQDPLRTQTPGRDVPDDDDIYGATPRRARPSAGTDDDPDDLDALIAEAEGHHPQKVPNRADQEPDGDDLDAMITEAERHDEQARKPAPDTNRAMNEIHDFADEEAALQEMEGLW